MSRTETINDRTKAPDEGAKPGLLVLFSEGKFPDDGVYPVQPEMTIGRHHGRFVFVEDPGMSRSHAAVRFGSGGVTVEDLGSHNGTLINGAPVERRAGLASGDVLRCGRTLLALVDDVEAFKGWRSWSVAHELAGGPVMEAVRKELMAYAPSDLEVLVTGESGTGKELAAGLVHSHSGLKGPLVPVNCAELPDALFEAELFGARKGAYTGAEKERVGLFRTAHGGTLFLDEVAELPATLQAKLLRAVEQGEVRPLGGDRPVKVDVRLVAATNRDLWAEVERGTFREDLLHRLAGARVRLPALREHPEDIPLLAERLILRHGGERTSASAMFMERLLLYRWPGNVRELQRVIRQALARATADGQHVLVPQHLRQELLEVERPVEDPLAAIKEALRLANGNVTHAAEALGMSRAQVYKLLAARGLRAEDFR